MKNNVPDEVLMVIVVDVLLLRHLLLHPMECQNQIAYHHCYCLEKNNRQHPEMFVVVVGVASIVVVDFHNDINIRHVLLLRRLHHRMNLSYIDQMANQNQDR